MKNCFLKSIVIVCVAFAFSLSVSASPVRIVYNPDNSVSVIYPAPKSQRQGESETDWLSRVFAKAMDGEMAGRAFDDIDTTVLPVSREFRDFWEGEKGKAVTINQVKRDAHLLRIANKAAIELQLDVELASSDPSPVEVIRLQRKLDKKDYD